MRALSRIALAATVGAALAITPLTASADTGSAARPADVIKTTCQTRIVNHVGEKRCKSGGLFKTFYVGVDCSNGEYYSYGPYTIPVFGGWSDWGGVSCGTYKVKKVY